MAKKVVKIDSMLEKEIVIWDFEKVGDNVCGLFIRETSDDKTEKRLIFDEGNDQLTSIPAHDSILIALAMDVNGVPVRDKKKEIEIEYLGEYKKEGVPFKAFKVSVEDD